MANAIDSEDKVHDSPDQGHEPNETHPRDGGARITFVENRVPGRQHREKQPKPDGSDVPHVVHQITKGLCHRGLSLSLVIFVFIVHFFSTLEAENAATRLGDHEFFVRANDTDRYPAATAESYADEATFCGRSCLDE